MNSGKDGRICVWPPVAAAAALHTATAAAIDLTALLQDSSADTAVRSVCLSADATKLLVGTQGSELWELSVTLPASVTAPAVTATVGNDGQPLTRGHCKSELWGLATHPGLREYCTAGDDGTLRIWNVRAHAQTASAKLCGMARACAYRCVCSSLLVYR
jgi:WD40 repeat protein